MLSKFSKGCKSENGNAIFDTSFIYVHIDPCVYMYE